MKRFSACSLALSFACALPALAADVGAPAPAFTLQGMDGAPLSLAQFKGKTVYLDFWASWCGPCRKSFPWMNAMQERYGGSRFAVVAVNVDADAKLGREFIAAHPAAFAVAFDPAGATPQAYRIKGMPSSVLVGPDGRVLAVHTGFSEPQLAEREQAIRAAIGAQR
jgi:thiol-disulfide isomerase/thioredoxin